jgi:hypothetical protein
MSWGKKAAGLLVIPALAFATAASGETIDGPPVAGPISDARAQAIECMTSAILHEAGFEPSEGQEAVAEVILNRLRSPAFPKTVCAVVFQGSERRTGCQFSFTCDGSLRKVLPLSAFIRAREVAGRAIDGQLTAHTFGATHYHADYVLPYWAPTLVRVATIGRHIFYRQPGGSEFSQLARYAASGEQVPAIIGSIVATASSSAVPEARGQQRRERERFMPWGLAPRPVLQSQSAEKQ